MDLVIPANSMSVFMETIDIRAGSILALALTNQKYVKTAKIEYI